MSVRSGGESAEGIGMQPLEHGAAIGVAHGDRSKRDRRDHVNQDHISTARCEQQCRAGNGCNRKDWRHSHLAAFRLATRERHQMNPAFGRSDRNKLITAA
uniref:Uncharacterized protein n=1 Tax=Calcidiscus leptoporus TaxID=127549 RepID=A0A7S0JDC9_9EUKA